jgi:predicted nucleic acid-binding protein
MAAYFFDSSALAKRYVAETGTAWVQSLVDPASDNEIYVARITLVELVSAITRRKRKGDLTPHDAAVALADLRADFASDYLPIEITASLVTQAEVLAERHTLRGYDAVQLAAALQVNGSLVAAGARRSR